MNIRKVVLVHSFNPPGPMRPVDADPDPIVRPTQWRITHVPTGEEHVLSAGQFLNRDFSLFSEAAQRDILIWLEEDQQLYKERRAAYRGHRFMDQRDGTFIERRDSKGF